MRTVPEMLGVRASIGLLAVAASIATAGAPSSATATATASDGRPWATLTATQRESLKPLEREWGTIDGRRQQKWIEIAERLPRMSPEERSRIQARMTEWATMTPQQRAQVRLHFQEARQVAPQHRKESWDAYQALPADERRRLASRAAEADATASAAPAEPARRGGRGDRAVRDAPQAKSNIVVTPSPAPAPRPVAPTVVQAQPGATTTLMSKPPTPPAHQQVGLPKIAATPDFVDTATLLPRRGAQGAAMRPVAVSEPASRPAAHR